MTRFARAKLPASSATGGSVVLTPIIRPAAFHPSVVRSSHTFHTRPHSPCPARCASSSHFLRPHANSESTGSRAFSNMWKVNEGDRGYMYGAGNGYTHSAVAADYNPHGLGHHHHPGLGHHHHRGWGHRLRAFLGHRSHDHHSSGWGHHSHDHYAPYSAGYATEMPAYAPVVVLKVEMHSERSRKVIMKKLSKLRGVMSVDVDIYNQRVTVTGNVTPAEVLKKVQKTGRKAHFWMDDTAHTSALGATPGYSNAGYSSGPIAGALQYTS